MEGGANYSRLILQGSSFDVGDNNAAAAAENDTVVVAHRSEWPLPLANLVRIMRHVLPDNTKISETAKELVHDCALEFAGFVINEAADRCRRQHRRTIAPEDLVWALQSLGFDDFIAPMSAYLRRYCKTGGVSNAVPRVLAPDPVQPPPSPAQATFSHDELEMLAQVLDVPLPRDGGAASSSTQMPPVMQNYDYIGYMPVMHNYDYTGYM